MIFINLFAIIAHVKRINFNIICTERIYFFLSNKKKILIIVHLRIVRYRIGIYNCGDFHLKVLIECNSFDEKKMQSEKIIIVNRSRE